MQRRNVIANIIAGNAVISRAICAFLGHPHPSASLRETRRPPLRLLSPRNSVRSSPNPEKFLKDRGGRKSGEFASIHRIYPKCPVFLFRTRPRT